MPLGSAKAKKMLKDGKVRGKKLTPKQRRFMGARAGGKRPKLRDLPAAARRNVK